MTGLHREDASRGTAAAVVPALSVVVCTHERPRYLTACLEGLARQDALSCGATTEIIVVDSASEPGSAAEIKRIAQDANAILLREEQPGLSRARNRGLAEARAPWTAYLDDDSVPEPDWLRNLIARIRVLPPDAAAVGGRILPEWESPLPVWWPTSLRGVLTIVEWEGAGEVGVDLPPEVDIYGANMAFGTEALRRVGGFPEDLGRVGGRLLSGEEVEVVERLRNAGYRCFYEGAATVRHYIQAERLRPAWLLSRLHWQGATDALRDRARHASSRLPRAAAKLALQAPLLLWPHRSPSLLRARCGAAYNLGYLRGALGT